MHYKLSSAQIINDVLYSVGLFHSYHCSWHVFMGWY